MGIVVVVVVVCAESGEEEEDEEERERDVGVSTRECLSFAFARGKKLKD